MHWLTLLLPTLYALFLWWFTTGCIMAVYGRSPRTVRLGFVGATLVMLAAVGGLILTRQMTHLSAVYLAFTCGTVLWGWHMASYYLGFVTGLPVQSPPGGEHEFMPKRSGKLAHRFLRALHASLYHELLVIGFALMMVMLTWSQTNQWGLWSFLTLWAMHVSAKLNVFFGVRNFRIEFLPTHLHSLGALLSKKPVNLLFPFSVGTASTVVFCLFTRALAPETAPTQVAGLVLVGTMIALGVFEHWLLVIPLPATIWGWGIRPLPQSSMPDLDAPRRRQSVPIRAMPEQMSES